MVKNASTQGRMYQYGIDSLEEKIVRNLSVNWSPALNRKEKFEQYIRKKYLQIVWCPTS